MAFDYSGAGKESALITVQHQMLSMANGVSTVNGQPVQELVVVVYSTEKEAVTVQLLSLADFIVQEKTRSTECAIRRYV